MAANTEETKANDSNIQANTPEAATVQEKSSRTAEQIYYIYYSIQYIFITKQEKSNPEIKE